MEREEILRLKKERRYSTMQLSDLTGVPVGTLTKILSGETKNPRVDTMKAIEDFFKSDLTVPGDLDLYHSNCRQPDTLMVAERALAYGITEKRQGEYTYPDLESLPEGRYAELIDGFLYDMSSPSLTHQNIIQYMFISIYSYIQKKGGNCKVYTAPVDVFPDCDDKTCLIPDLFIICDRDKISNRGINGAPDLILEVISPSTSKKDKTIKAHKYYSSGVHEYWIIDPFKKNIMIFNYDTPETYVSSLKGKHGIGIFNNDLIIDLNELLKIASEFD